MKRIDSRTDGNDANLIVRCDSIGRGTVRR